MGANIMESTKSDKLIEFMKMGTISVPKYIFLNYKKLGMNEQEFILIIYLLNIGNKIQFNPKIIANELDIKLPILLEIINSLTEKQLLSINLEKNNIGVMEEFISLDLFYNKLSMIMVDMLNKNDEKIDNNLFQIFENEFGRTLSPMEYEIINGWVSEKFSNQIIIEALKEATFNGVSSLRYIDKILYEWKKKGIKNVSDIKNIQNRHKEQKKEIEIFDYDWLDGE